MVSSKCLRIKKTQLEGEISSDNYDFVVEDTPALKDGEVLLKNLYISIDPTHRIYITGEPSYFPAFKVGDKIPAGLVGEVIESKAPALPVGSVVSGWAHWEEYSVCSSAGISKLDPKGVSLEGAMAVMNVVIGLTAWAGIREIMGIEKGKGQGKVVCISGASGAVGSLACQIAKADGAKVVGIAGGKEKCEFLKEVGCDVVVDYKAGDVGLQIKDKCPEGFTHYFENVGGKITEAVLAHMQMNGKVALCGFIDQYNKGGASGTIKAWDQILFKRLMVKGFICLDHVASIATAFAELGGLLAENKLKYRTEVLSGGIDKCVDGLLAIMRSTRGGKVMVKLAEPSNKEFRLK